MQLDASTVTLLGCYQLFIFWDIQWLLMINASNLNTLNFIVFNTYVIKINLTACNHILVTKRLLPTLKVVLHLMVHLLSMAIASLSWILSAIFRRSTASKLATVSTSFVVWTNSRKMMAILLLSFSVFRLLLLKSLNKLFMLTFQRSIFRHSILRILEQITRIFVNNGLILTSHLIIFQSLFLSSSNIGLQCLNISVFRQFVLSWKLSPLFLFTKLLKKLLGTKVRTKNLLKNMKKFWMFKINLIKKLSLNCQHQKLSNQQNPNR